MNHLTKLLEAALYSASRPLTINELKALDPTAKKGEVQAALEELRVLLDSGDHGVELVQLAEGFQILTRPEFAEAIADARIAQRPRKLSGAAMETLAIISYRQPVGRAEIEEIRGVAADGVLRSLSERGLIDVAGRGEGLGRPLLYGTTPKFLEMIGLQDVSQLPRLEELSVALTPVMDRLGDEDEADDEQLTTEPEVQTEELETRTDETESLTDEAESTIDDSETTSDETESPTDEAESPIADSETTTDETENPTDQAESPIDDSETTTDETESPTDEADNPTAEAEIPIDHSDTAMGEIEKPTDQKERPAVEDQTPEEVGEPTESAAGGLAEDG